MEHATYKPAKGSHLTPEQAQRYGEALHAIEEENNGQITPTLIIENAKSESSPLHDYFEWDDKRAACEYRLFQARYLARSIALEVNSVPTRAFQFVIENNTNVYTSASRVFSTEDLRKQVIARALKELEGWKARYSQYQEFSKIFAAIEEVKMTE